MPDGVQHEVLDGTGDLVYTGRGSLLWLADLDAWASWLDSLGITHSGAIDAADPMPYSTLVFRDPDNVQLEIFYMDAPG